MLSPSKFDRARLPSAVAYYAQEGLRLVGTGAWRSANCPFHTDSGRSLRVRVETGSYRCKACGARGMDHLSFHRARYGLNFRMAAQDLGAWTE